MSTAVRSRSLKESQPSSPSSFSSKESSPRSLINRQLRAAWSRKGRVGNSREGHENRKKRKHSSHRREEFDPASLFLGSRTKREVTKLLEPQSFVLFYPIPEDEDSIVASLPLELAYKKTDGKIYFYPVVRKKIGWAVDFAENYKQPTFQNLTELIEYYNIYRYLDVASQQMEAFPFPEVAEMSESDNTVFELPVGDT